MNNVLSLGIILVAANTVAADVIHVPADYPTIQAAILAALEGDEIIVAPGSYNEAIFFNGHNIVLRSSGGPDVTTIDATGLNNTVVRVILGEGPTTVLEGFTITNGISGFGGGIYCDSSDPTIQDCIITMNTATSLSNGGGGMFATNSDITLVGCRFINNTASGNVSGGGGVRCIQGSDLSFLACEFIGNTSRDGGAIFSNASSIELTRCLLEQNQAAINNGSGGGIYATFSNVSLTNCSVIKNSANQFGGAAYLITNTSSSFVNCLIAGNYTELNNGGGLCTANATLTITNCTIAENSSPQTGGGVISMSQADMLLIDNSLLWGNTPDSLAGSGTIQVSYSNIEFGWPGCDFCILADPWFADPLDGNYRLAPGSPCIDLGNNAAVPIGVDADMDGNPRFVDDPNTPDCPQPGADCGVPPIVDMGAYEFDFCPWDLDGNCEVGAGDLLLLLANWGNPYGAADLLELLASWGPCQCNPSADPPTLQEELNDACLTWDDWDEFEDVMTDPNAPQVKKDRYLCWMEHYLFDCNRCTCPRESGCPDPDPFD